MSGSRLVFRADLIMIQGMAGSPEDALLAGREVIFEFHPIGLYVRVSAIDAASLTEISIQGPSNAPPDLLKRNAIKRLAFVLKKKGVL